MQEFRLKILPQDAGKRIDSFLAEFFKNKNLGFSRTYIQRLILKGKVLSGADKIKPHHKIKADEVIKGIIEERKTNNLLAEHIPLEIIYEDKDLAVINKRPGLVVHPAPGNYEHTLVNALLYHFKNLSDINPQRPGIVHRLDKETSGLLVIAKNNFSHLGLASQFAKHTIQRRYMALVKGRMEFDEHVIELPIGRHPVRRKEMSVGFGDKAKYAKTYYRTLKRTEDFSLLELMPFTGRTHQLRVHLAFLGHPILGDTKYGKNNDLRRLALHAKDIGFIHPRTKRPVNFSSPIPEDFSQFINKNKS